MYAARGQAFSNYLDSCSPELRLAASQGWRRDFPRWDPFRYERPQSSVSRLKWPRVGAVGETGWSILGIISC
jgi:hypothetical protein